jgi:hypothetical protein
VDQASHDVLTSVAANLDRGIVQATLSRQRQSFKVHEYTVQSCRHCALSCLYLQNNTASTRHKAILYLHGNGSNKIESLSCL